MHIIRILEDGNVKKAAIKLDDNYIIETSFEYPFWICISTQVGCKNKCIFCKSGCNGFKRNLTCNEMLEQIKLCVEFCIDEFSNERTFFQVSFSGIGEPLFNVNEVGKCIQHIQKHLKSDICITTSGIANSLENLMRFFDVGKIGLDLSVHAVDKNKRALLMPIENTYPLVDSIRFIKQNKIYFRWIHYDYLMLEEFNDTQQDLDMLINTFEDQDATIELKKYNRIDEYDLWNSSSEKTVQYFAEELKKHNINAFFERNLGTSINAGCGQLVWEYELMNKE